MTIPQWFCYRVPLQGRKCSTKHGLHSSVANWESRGYSQWDLGSTSRGTLIKCVMESVSSTLCPDRVICALSAVNSITSTWCMLTNLENSGCFQAVERAGDPVENQREPPVNFSEKNWNGSNDLAVLNTAPIILCDSWRVSRKPFNVISIFNKNTSFV